MPYPVADDHHQGSIRAEMRAVGTRVRQRHRQFIARRELKKLIREAPTPTVRNDLMEIAARNDTALHSG